MSINVVGFLDEPLVTPIGQPLRVAVYSRLAHGIRTRVLDAGTLLPREIELASSLRVSRTVVREALMLLEEDGLILTKRGVGRFVSLSLPRVGLEEFRPFEQVLSTANSSLTVQPLEFTLQLTTDFISDKLSLDSTANAWFRECLVLRDGMPIAIVQEHLPAGRYLVDISPRLASALEPASNHAATLCASLLAACGPVFTSGVCQIAAGVAGPTRAALLGLQAEDPVTILTQTAEFDGAPVYLAKCIIAPHIGSLTIIQSNPS